MRVDGHIKITEEAIGRISSIPLADDGGLVEYLLGSSFDSSDWENPGKGNEKDNRSAFKNWAITAESKKPLSHRIAGVDLLRIWSKKESPDGGYWTHAAQNGQPYHFMGWKDESEMMSYTKAVEFIHTHAKSWIKAAYKCQESERKDSASYGQSVIDLALALHSLQDSFSPGHTIRSRFPVNLEVATEKNRLGYVGGNKGETAPIRKIYTYTNQNKNDHQHADHAGGSLDKPLASLAVSATVDFFWMGWESITTKSGELDRKRWKKFVNTWLVQADLGFQPVSVRKGTAHSAAKRVKE